ncbi:hypothetical protein ABE10_01940, partial [Bacillus toyonensis]|nr:hypothetical protein [Bacillus toyonensis]
EVRHQSCSLERELERDVHVCGIDGGGAARTGGGDGVRVVEPRPRELRQLQGHLSPCAERGHGLGPFATDVLAREQRRIFGEVCGLDTFGRPAGGVAVGVAGLVEDVIQRVAATEGHRVREVVAEGVGGRLLLEQGPDRLPAVIRSQRRAH